MKLCLILRNLSGSGGSLLVGTTPKCLRYLSCPSFIQERKRLSERVNPKLNTGGQEQPLFPLSGLSLKKGVCRIAQVYVCIGGNRWGVLHGIIDTGTTIAQVLTRVGGDFGSNDVVSIRMRSQ
ncbi:hypothetical protein HanIR_Chr17g0893451 [Helianthus annuus]|nr:hypothetical protein HanIR_Chr17g0893451 [Helianthus annuus]